MPKKKIYLAGGWFTPEMAEEHTRIYEMLKDEYDVFNPRIAGEIDSTTTHDKMSQILIGNIEAIKNADLVVVIYDYKDTGTIWESGFAYACKKPIVYYAEKLNGKAFNLMLAKTGNFASDEVVLDKMLSDRLTWTFKDVYDSYKGVVE